MRAWQTTGVALVALTAAMLPASVLGQAADDEYSLNIPGASSGGDNPGSANSSGTVETGAGGKAPDSTSSATGSGNGVEGSAGANDVAGAGAGSSSSAGGSGSHDGDHNAATGDAGEGGGANARTNPAGQSAPTVTSAASDEGGAPIALIVLAVVAALGTAVAVWRMRKRGDQEHAGVGLGSGPAAATGETQSL